MNHAVSTVLGFFAIAAFSQSENAPLMLGLAIWFAVAWLTIFLVETEAKK